MGNRRRRIRDHGIIVAITITAALVLGTLGAVAPATAAPASSVTTGSVATAVAAAVAPTAIIPVPVPLPAKTSLSGTVSGRTLTSGTKPLAGVYVRAFTATTSVGAVTDATGKYTLTGLSSGSYKVSYNSYDTSAGFAYANQYWQNKATEAQATPITVGKTSLNGYNVTLQQGATISGLLTMKIGTKSTPATTVRKVTTYLDGSKIGVDRYINVDAKGKYSITGLTAGSYKVSFGDVGAKAGLRGEFYNNATTLAASKAITVGFAKSITGINAELAGKPDIYVSTGVYGNMVVGQPLTGYVYTVPSDATATYQWYRNGIAITGATKLDYTTVAADLGKTVSITVKASKTGYTAASSTGSAWNVIAPGELVANQPKISGTAKVGSTLTATVGLTTPKPSKVTYVWQRSGTPITGATASTYRLVAQDKGATISVRTKATLAGYNSATRVSTSTVRVP
ncbi:hypothetical protein [Cryobacterium sp. AP23]